MALGRTCSRKADLVHLRKFLAEDPSAIDPGRDSARSVRQVAAASLVPDRVLIIIDGPLPLERVQICHLKCNTHLCTMRPSERREMDHINNEPLDRNSLSLARR